MKPERIFEVTPAAIEQIRASATRDKPMLRVAAKRAEDGTLLYGMGFDDARENDLVLDFGELTLLIAPFSRQLLTGASLDFVEIEPGEFQFVFINPNDPAAGPAPAAVTRESE
ncbi:MAG: hypothetical protein OHK0026_10850 [Rhodocyclaceae bacterium]